MVNIYLCCDDMALAEVFADELRTRDYFVTVQTSGTSALGEIETGLPMFDVLLVYEEMGKLSEDGISAQQIINLTKEEASTLTIGAICEQKPTVLGYNFAFPFEVEELWLNEQLHNTKEYWLREERVHIPFGAWDTKPPRASREKLM